MGGNKMGYVSKTAVVAATVTIPARSNARSISIVTGTPTPSTTPSAPPQQAVAKATPTLQVIQYAAAVLKGQPGLLEAMAQCFVSDNARIRKHEEGWILESSEFASCTAGEQVFPIADDIAARIHRILALYCGATPTISVEHIYWINAAGEPLRSIRGSISVNVISSEGLAELKTMRGTHPLGSVVFQSMIPDAAVREALTLHGESGLSCSQIYDIIEFLGGASGIAKAGYANAKQTRAVRQTANHYRHLGSSKNSPLPPNPPTLGEATDFARGLLQRWISSRV
jgi:hypothetical protein